MSCSRCCDDDVYYERPIALRNPVVFYEGHLPAFAVNTLIRKALGEPGVDPDLEVIFARGIDPDTEATAVARGNPAWPSRETVAAYASEADRLIEDGDRVGGSGTRGQPAARSRAGALGDSRARGDAPGDARVHVAPAALQCEAEAAGYVTLPDTPTRADSGGDVRVPAGRALIGTSGRGAVCVGQRAADVSPSTFQRSPSTWTT